MWSSAALFCWLWMKRWLHCIMYSLRAAALFLPLIDEHSRSTGRHMLRDLVKKKKAKKATNPT